MSVKQWKKGLLVGLVVATSACSSSQKGQDQATDPLDSDLESAASTDAVPQTSSEAPVGDLDQQADSSPAKTTSNDVPPAEDPSPSLSSPSSSSDISKSSVIGSSPAHESHDSSDSMSSTQTQDYTVAVGDTLMKIAFQNYGDVYKWKVIYETNKDKIPDPSKMRKGLVLHLPAPLNVTAVEESGEKYLIKTGDTLGKISSEVYGTPKKWKKLWENNKSLIHDPNKIFAGFYLRYVISPEEAAQKDTLKAQNISQPTGNAAPPANLNSQPQVQPSASIQREGIPDAPALPEAWQNGSVR